MLEIKFKAGINASELKQNIRDIVKEVIAEKQIENGGVIPHHHLVSVPNRQGLQKALEQLFLNCLQVCTGKVKETGPDNP